MKHLPSDYQPDSQLLQDKVILVTGAGDGIGRQASLTFAQHGATVVLLGRTTQKLEYVYDEIEAAGGPQAAIYPINFEGACEKDYDDLAIALDNEFGRLDGFLHNAAELGQRTPFNNYASEVWQRVMQVNVNATFMLTQALLPLLDKSAGGTIIYTGSSVGYQGRAFWGAYAASKAANENMVQTLAQELEGTSAIRINSVNPGATRTKMRAAAYPAENPASVKSAEDLMPLYLYLISADSAPISGEQFSYR